MAITSAEAADLIATGRKVPRMQQTIEEQCADKDVHARHPWGWRRVCPGVNLADGVGPDQIERLAALHHETLRTIVADRIGVCVTQPWQGLDKVAKEARVRAMREVLNDLKNAR